MIGVKEFMSDKLQATSEPFQVIFFSRDRREVVVGVSMDHLAFNPTHSVILNLVQDLNINSFCY